MIDNEGSKNQQVMPCFAWTHAVCPSICAFNCEFQENSSQHHPAAQVLYFCFNEVLIMAF